MTYSILIPIVIQLLVSLASNGAGGVFGVFFAAANLILGISLIAGKSPLKLAGMEIAAPLFIILCLVWLGASVWLLLREKQPAVRTQRRSDARRALIMFPALALFLIGLFLLILTLVYPAVTLAVNNPMLFRLFTLALLLALAAFLLVRRYRNMVQIRFSDTRKVIQGYGVTPRFLFGVVAVPLLVIFTILVYVFLFRLLSEGTLGIILGLVGLMLFSVMLVFSVYQMRRAGKAGK